MKACFDVYMIRNRSGLISKSHVILLSLLHRICPGSAFLHRKMTVIWDALFLLQTHTHTHTHSLTTGQSSRSDWHIQNSRHKCTEMCCGCSYIFPIGLQMLIHFSRLGNEWKLSSHQNVENTHTATTTLKLLVKLNHLVWAQFYSMKIFFLEKSIVFRYFLLLIYKKTCTFCIHLFIVFYCIVLFCGKIS